MIPQVIFSLPLYQSPTHAIFLDLILLCKFQEHVAAHYLCLKIDLLSRSFRSAFSFFPDMAKARLICTSTLSGPWLPICFLTDFMKDMNCMAARLLWLHLQHWPCAFPSLSFFTAVSVSARKGEGYFMAMQTVALHSTLSVMSPDLPRSFPKCIFQGFLMTSHAVLTSPSAALIPLSQGVGLLVRWSKKVLFYIQCLSFLPSSEAIIFPILEHFRGCDIENSSCIYSRCCLSCNDMPSIHTHTKAEQTQAR